MAPTDKCYQRLPRNTQHNASFHRIKDCHDLAWPNEGQHTSHTTRSESTECYKYDCIQVLDYILRPKRLGLTSPLLRHDQVRDTRDTRDTPK